MTYLALKEVGSAEAQTLPWQHTSYLSMNFVRNIHGFFDTASPPRVDYLQVAWAIASYCHGHTQSNLIGLYDYGFHYP